jgi:hypothetical protein
VLIAVVVVVATARAEEPEQPTAVVAEASTVSSDYPARGLAIYPAGPGKGQERWTVGGLWQIAPMFTGSYTRGLGLGFSVDAAVQTIVLYNQLGVGGQ